MIRETTTKECYFEIKLFASDVVIATIQSDLEEELEKLFDKHPDDEFVVTRVEVFTKETYEGPLSKRRRTCEF